MGKINKILIRLVLFLLIFTTITLVVIYFISKITFSLENHDFRSEIMVWLDENGDGIRDTNEPPLSNVCVWAGWASVPEKEYTYHVFSSSQAICRNQQGHMTNSDGAWSDIFEGGCVNIYAAIHPPDGYFPTTPTLTKGCKGKFGLSRKKPIREIQFVDAGQYLESEYKKGTARDLASIIVVCAASALVSGFISVKVIRP